MSVIIFFHWGQSWQCIYRDKRVLPSRAGLLSYQFSRYRMSSGREEHLLPKINSAQFSEMISPPRISGKLSKGCDITVSFDMLARFQSEVIPTRHLAIFVVITASESC